MILTFPGRRLDIDKLEEVVKLVWQLLLSMGKVPDSDEVAHKPITAFVR